MQAHTHTNRHNTKLLYHLCFRVCVSDCARVVVAGMRPAARLNDNCIRREHRALFLSFSDASLCVFERALFRTRRSHKLSASRQKHHCLVNWQRTAHTLLHCSDRTNIIITFIACVLLLHIHEILPANHFDNSGQLRRALISRFCVCVCVCLTLRFGRENFYPRIYRTVSHFGNMKNGHLRMTFRNWYLFGFVTFSMGATNKFSRSPKFYWLWLV